MKTYSVALAIALAAVLMLSDTAEARRWVYLHAGPAHVHVVPRVTLRTVHPVIVPYATTVVTPTVTPTYFIGPRGRLHYVAPVQPIVVGPYIGW
jgi:hypothetical protein